MPYYAADGSQNVTVVTDVANIKGLYAPDGSTYVAPSPGASNKNGAHAPNGARYYTKAIVDKHAIRAPDGSLQLTNNNSKGARKVTVISGVL